MEHIVSKKVSPIPRGYRTATPVLTVFDIDSAVGFYQAAFGAELLTRNAGAALTGLSLLRELSQRASVSDRPPLAVERRERHQRHLHRDANPTVGGDGLARAGALAVLEGIAFAQCGLPHPEWEGLDSGLISVRRAARDKGG